MKTEIDSILRDRILESKKRKLEAGPSKFERITPEETYLLGANNERIKRICGVQIKTLPSGFVCLQSAGSGTLHVGSGRCRFHSRKLCRIPLQITQILDSGYGAEIKQRLYDCDMSKELMNSLEPEIELLYGILTERINQDEVNVREIREIAAQLTTIKKMNIENQQRTLFTKEEVFKYIQFVIETCRIVLQEAQFIKLVALIQASIGQEINGKTLLNAPNIKIDGA